MLREIGSDELVGQVEIRSDDPTMLVARDVLWVPDRPGHGWGVFDRDGEPLPASLDYNLPWNEPMWPKPDCPVRWSEVTDHAPDRDYIYLGFVHIHFGHFLVDSLSRLWPLVEGGLQGRKILFHGWGDPAFWRAEMPWVAELFDGLGLEPDDFEKFDRPVRIRRLELPGRSFQGQTFAHQAHKRLCREIGAGILGEVDAAAGPPVYLSKTRLRSGVRRVTNEHQLEAFLRARGVEIAYPELLSVREQIGWFAGGRTVVGTTTSCFHLSLFAPPEGRIIALEPWGKVNSNHRMFDKLNGNRAVYLEPLGTRQLPPPPPEWMVLQAFRDPVAIGRELLHWL